jgi:hypothetical protein
VNRLSPAFTTVAAWAGLVFCALACPGSAHAVCKDVTVSATGAEKATIEAATASAGAALAVKIAAAHGKIWTAGSHRNGSFHCDKILAGRKPGWTCTATTTAICAPISE